ncbi:hypothetical protein B0H10DRAFT_2089810 [Mycena sp. CBHHK59/15]|nr:hypothetical protein B0H10DRAFT_2089810 [Mycena sp. CBHHK59/15]
MCSHCDCHLDCHPVCHPDCHRDCHHANPSTFSRVPGSQGQALKLCLSLSSVFPNPALETPCRRTK